MKLPSSNILPIENLSGVFNNTTNSYKFYWFLAILEKIKNTESENFLIDELIIEMIASAWYPIDFFKLSFGRQDKLSQTIIDLKIAFAIPDEIKKNDLLILLKKEKGNKNLKKLIDNLARYVPYRSLSPWFTSQLIGRRDAEKNRIIYDNSSMFFNSNAVMPLYKFSSDQKQIIIADEWLPYLSRHLSILQGYTFWHLINYLQKNNPNTTNIQNKLFPPIIRDLKVAKLFWKNYLMKQGSVRCIYSGYLLKKDELSIDHFIPWSFVAHDQLWNLLPIPKCVNSAKSNNIPAEKHLSHFAELQYNAFQFSINSEIIKPKVLEDYSILFKDTLKNIAMINKYNFENVIVENIKPLMQIAVNMGFPGEWVYRQ